MMGQVLDRHLLEATFYNPRLNKTVHATPWVVVRFLASRHWPLFGLLILCGVMALALAGFLGYHLYLTSINVTTNESYKWADLRAMYKARDAHRLKHGKKERAAEASGSKDGDEDGRNQTMRRIENSHPLQRDVTGKESMENGEQRRVGEEEHGSEGNTKQGVENDGQLGDFASDGESSVEEPIVPQLPERFPRNIYNRGVLQNFLEVLFPLSLRKQSTLEGDQAVPERKGQATKGRGKGTSKRKKRGSVKVD